MRDTRKAQCFTLTHEIECHLRHANNAQRIAHEGAEFQKQLETHLEAAQAKCAKLLTLINQAQKEANR